MLSVVRNSAWMSRIEPLESRLAFSIAIQAIPVPDSDQVPRVNEEPIIQVPITMAGMWYASIAPAAESDKAINLRFDIQEAQPDGSFTAAIRFIFPDSREEVVLASGNLFGKDGFYMAWEETRTNCGRIQGQFLQTQLEIPAYIRWNYGVDLIESDLPMARPLSGGRPLVPVATEPGGTIIGSMTDLIF